MLNPLHRGAYLQTEHIFKPFLMVYFKFGTETAVEFVSLTAKIRLFLMVWALIDFLL